jgi:hypothetical protein
VYDPAAGAWRDLSAAFRGTPPSPRILHGFTSAGGKLYVHGGQVELFSGVYGLQRLRVSVHMRACRCTQAIRHTSSVVHACVFERACLCARVYALGWAHRACNCTRVRVHVLELPSLSPSSHHPLISISPYYYTPPTTTI